MDGETTDLAPTNTIEPPYENGAREAIGAALLFVTGTTLTATATASTASMVVGQLRHPLLGSSFWPITTGLLVIAFQPAIILAMMILIAIVAASYEWPAIGDFDEYRIAGAAGVLGLSIAIAAPWLHYASLLTVIGGPLPQNTVAFIVLAVVGAPAGYFFARLLTADIQFESARPPPSSDVESTQLKRERTLPASPTINRGRSHGKESRATHNPGHNPNSRSESSGEPNVQSSIENANSGPQTSDYEFDWETETDVSLDDVGGMEELKSKLRKDIILPLTSGKEHAKVLDIPLPNVLFHGPPGTGKTFISKALATELGLPFVNLSGGDIQSKWINASAKKINSLFAEASYVAEQHGGAVIFIDEIDTVLKSRDSGSGHDEDQKVVNEFLRHLQETNEQDILVIGATNRLDSLDQAAIRAGRFDRKIHVGLPDEAARTAIIRAQLRDRPHHLQDHHIEEIARLTDGWSAADLESLIVDSARESAFERGESQIRWRDIVAVRDSD